MTFSSCKTDKDLIGAGRDLVRDIFNKERVEVGKYINFTELAVNKCLYQHKKTMSN